MASNISSPLIHGTLDPTHTTNLHLDYGSLPTPWPFLCATIAVSVFLALISLVSALVRRRNKDDDDDDSRKSISFSTVLTTVGLLWTTIRAITTLVICARVARGSSGEYPDLSAIVISMISSQTYLISDGILRIIGPLVVFDIAANFASLLLARFGTSSLHSYHGYLKPIGGNCPLLEETCISGMAWTEWGSVGCPPFVTNTTTYNTTEALVPFNSFPIGANLSDIANPLNSQEIAISDLGIVYGIAIIAPAMLFLIQFLDSARWLGPFRARTGFAIVFATGSIIFMGIIAGVILPPSIALVQHPPTHVFIDSLGLGRPIFHPDPDLYAYNFTGGDSTHWSDCFNVTAPSDHFGFWGEWWAAKEDRVAHILAVL